MEKIFVENIKAITLEVYTIGYKDKGESQIIILFDNHSKIVLLSFVIDCYSIEGINKTIEILDSYNIKTIDYFIWTHTDEDHSVGILEILNSFCSNKTSFFLPDLVTGNEKDFIEYNEYIKECFDKINSFNKGTNYSVNSVTASTFGHSTLLRKDFADSSLPLSFTFEVLGIAPKSALIRRRWDSGIVRKKNDLSIATIFKVGELALLFSGDIEDPTIELIPEYYFENLNYIKTPHHTSYSSAKLINKIQSLETDHKISSAVTTTYKKHFLPDEELIKLYKKHVESFSSTGSGNYQFGYIKTTYYILDNSYEEELFGDAVNY